MDFTDVSVDIYLADPVEISEKEMACAFIGFLCQILNKAVDVF